MNIKLALNSVFSLGDKYRLELHWDSLEYKDNYCLLKNALFCGPVLAIAEAVLPNDDIQLDLVGQYLNVANIYILSLKWGNVRYNANNTISLSDCVLYHPTELHNSVQLKNNDMLIIDTEDHEDYRHANTLLYKAYVVNEDRQLYKFNGVT